MPADDPFNTMEPHAFRRLLSVLRSFLSSFLSSNHVVSSIEPLYKKLDYYVLFLGSSEDDIGAQVSLCTRLDHSIQNETTPYLKELVLAYCAPVLRIKLANQQP